MTSNSSSTLKTNPYMTLKNSKTVLEVFERIVDCVGTDVAFDYIRLEWGLYEYFSVCSTPTASYLPWVKSLIFESASLSMKYWLDEAGVEHDYNHEGFKLSGDDYVKFFYVPLDLGIKYGLTYDRYCSSIDDDCNSTSQIDWDDMIDDAGNDDDLLDVESYNSLPDVVLQIQSDFLDLARTVGGTAAIETMLERDNPVEWIWMTHFGPFSSSRGPEFQLFRVAYVTLKDHLKIKGIETRYFLELDFSEAIQNEVIEMRI